MRAPELGAHPIGILLLRSCSNFQERSGWHSGPTLSFMQQTCAEHCGASGTRVGLDRRRWCIAEDPGGGGPATAAPGPHFPPLHTPAGGAGHGGPGNQQKWNHRKLVISDCLPFKKLKNYWE